jgi:hypothetical protein
MMKCLHQHLACSQGKCLSFIFMLTWIDNILKPIRLYLAYIFLKIHIYTYPTDILRLI